MSFNNTSKVSNPKKNLRRTNRLQNNGNFTSFDNAGYVDDKDNKSSHTPTLKEEKRKKRDENSTKRRLPEPKMSNPAHNSRDPESVEMRVKDGKDGTKKENRNVLDSINVSPYSNNEALGVVREESQEGADSVRPLSGGNGKASKSFLLNNLKKFEAATKNTPPVEDRLIMPRPSLVGESRSGYGALDTSPFARASSMREGKVRIKPPRKLLRDISFSDASDCVIKDYGALKTMNLPPRQDDEPMDDETLLILKSMLLELTKRGKVHHAAVLDKTLSVVLASVPAGLLTRGDAIGMTKSFMCPPTLFKLKIGDHEYCCFKHRQNAVQGRAPDLVMVMQVTATCVVVGFSRDNAPGSCNSEVNEFTKVLEDARW